MGEPPTPAPAENTTPNTHNVVADLVFGHPEYRAILDIPCGEGAFVRRCLARGLSVSAADCVPFEGLGGADFAIADMNQPLPHDDDAFDAVVCIDGIEHIERPFDFIRESARVTRRGGSVVISTPNISAVRSRWRWLLTGFHAKCKSPLDEADPNPLHHINMLSLPELRYMLHTAGFRITDIRTNRYKLISLAYALLVPLSYLVTMMTLLKQERKSPEGRRRNREVIKQLFSGPVLFGETLIVMARNDKTPTHDRRLDPA
jgi:2-polyprenyl-3-methyl-5-hydroxy-6-metoxy-1,4-benzoquinol methylase